MTALLVIQKNYICRGHDQISYPVTDWGRQGAKVGKGIA